jgi:hypothetical protein
MELPVAKLGIVVLSVLLPLALACSQQPSGGPAQLPSPTPSDAVAAAPNPLLYTPTGPPPKLDTSIASVSLDKVVFDTFRGGFIPLSTASDREIEDLRDAIKPIYEPRFAPAEGSEWLRDGDLVIGYTSKSGARAYPVRMLNLHEIVNDHIDGVPVLISYCPLCASAVVYSRELDDRTLVFGNTSALHESDLVMFDYQTGSYWFQVLGEAIVGPLTGKRLEMLPSVTVPWGEWRRLHPRTTVLSIDQGLFQGASGNRYAGDPFRGYSERLNQGQFAFPVSPEKLDGRLLPGDPVIAIQVAESHKAYALSGRSDWLLNDLVGGQRVVVLGRANGPTGVAFLSSADDRALSFRLAAGFLEDLETGSRWDDGGVAVSGPLAGARLSPLPLRSSFWFSLAGALPGIDLYKP